MSELKFIMELKFIPEQKDIFNLILDSLKIIDALQETIGTANSDINVTLINNHIEQCHKILDTLKVDGEMAWKQ